MALEKTDTSVVNDPKLPLTNIAIPTSLDVLCGRGVARNRHIGNENFRALVKRHKGTYVCSTKAAKMKISRFIVHSVRSRKGRFLEKDVESCLWFDIGDKKAMEKTSQALRDGAAPLRRQLAAMKDLNFTKESKDKLPNGQSFSSRTKVKKTKWRSKITNQRNYTSNQKNIKSNADFSIDTSTMKSMHLAKNVSRDSSPGLSKTQLNLPSSSLCSHESASIPIPIPKVRDISALEPIVVSPSPKTRSNESSSPFLPVYRNTWIPQLPSRPYTNHFNPICDDHTAKLRKEPRLNYDFQVRPPYLPRHSSSHQVPATQPPESVLTGCQLQQHQRHPTVTEMYNSPPFHQVPFVFPPIQSDQGPLMQQLKHEQIQSVVQEPESPVSRSTINMQSYNNEEGKDEFDDLSPLPYKDEDESFFSDTSDGLDVKNHFWLNLIQSPLIEE